MSKIPEELRPSNSDDNREITGLSLDSRRIETGYLFAALPSAVEGGPDGFDFIPQALASGATTILVASDKDTSAYEAKVAVLKSDNPRQTISLLAAAFSEEQPQTLVAITGTNGKTSIATFTRQIWGALGHKAASLGTLGIYPPIPNAPAALTTPDSIGLFNSLKDLATLGYSHLALEASSHGLDQYRLDGLRLKAAAFSNLSQDHLDYHPDMVSYLDAKLRLFRDLLPAGATAVLNADMPEYRKIAKICAGKNHQIISYGHTTSDLQIIKQNPTTEGQDLTLCLFGELHEVTLPVTGSFQASNIMAAVGLTLADGADLKEILAILPSLEGVPGRAEKIGKTAKGGAVYVDYAHTPNAVEIIIQALRPHTSGKLSIIIGCGGDRDPGKRPLMGRIADKLADQAYITDDNPRTEDPATIRAQAMAAAPNAIEIDDRKKAIFRAVSDLSDGDLLIIAGKGHESGQIVGDKVLPFDDRIVAKEAIEHTLENRNTAQDTGDPDRA
ncbi:UDP-N-acetylmuramoyl-L-alanyl-D-glutamate--2,6-diaminopimelate ligase [Kiloniella sp. EL199]|uniref:UDP-N-acetylmuramoyl-L-alanyl-D-glutamate--2, 6-diaminopimelate ligase n=1 Tax=Kiloniella sp. EL199 TaxID=2107581 RepID=UPI0020B1194D|nr:UDP-N-acetylmuramoyl-L-alanyl-D-glutamate--2,6-diaminopimelate ligase [Kiloniella sp. EL199]